MTDDLIKQLREHETTGRCMEGTVWLAKKAADLIEQQAVRVSGLLDQHGRDSAELRRLCDERDKAKERVKALEAKCGLLAASLAQSEGEVDSLKRDIERHIANHAADLSAVAPAVDAPPVAWRYLTPTGWHATTDMGKALGAAKHHDMDPLYSRAPTEAKDES